MLVFRGGAKLTMCDGCYRPKRTGEAGWVKGKATRPYRSPDEVVTGAPSTAALPVGVDYCPDCAPGPVAS